MNEENNNVRFAKYLLHYRDNKLHNLYTLFTLTIHQNIFFLIFLNYFIITSSIFYYNY